MNKDEVLQSLTELYAEEVEAALRYLHLSVTLADEDRSAHVEDLLEGVQETLEHARVIAGKVRELGGVPHLQVRIHLPGEIQTGQAALLQANEFETAARDAYSELAEQAEGDADLQEFAEAQVALENCHLQRFRELLGE